MRLWCTVGVILLNAGMIAQSTPSSCPADRPVDDIIAEVSKQQAKKNRRNPNPLPDVICIWGWCRERPRTPPPVPEPVPRAEIPSSGEESSSSKNATTIQLSQCDDAMESALKAAQDIEVGDYYFIEKKNYKGAQFRYEAAAREKPRDAAIHVRLGRVFEKLDQSQRAIEEYKAADLSSTFYRKDPSLPSEQRYYDGVPPEIMRFGSAWPGANFQLVDKETEVVPDIHLFTLVSDKPGTLELRELSLAINTPEGMVIVVGCSHPGIDKIVAAAAAINPRIHVNAGGFHLVVTSDADIEKIVTALHDTFKVEYVAPGHCTGEPAFAALKKAFGDRYIYAGLGTTVEVPHSSQK